MGMMSWKNRRRMKLMEKIALLEKEHEYALANMNVYDALHDRYWHKRAESLGEELVYKKSLLFLGIV